MSVFSFSVLPFTEKRKITFNTTDKVHFHDEVWPFLAVTLALNHGLFKGGPIIHFSSGTLLGKRAPNDLFFFFFFLRGCSASLNML